MWLGLDGYQGSLELTHGTLGPKNTHTREPYNSDKPTFGGSDFLTDGFEDHGVGGGCPSGALSKRERAPGLGIPGHRGRIGRPPAGALDELLVEGLDEGPVRPAPRTERRGGRGGDDCRALAWGSHVVVGTRYVPAAAPSTETV